MDWKLHTHWRHPVDAQVWILKKEKWMYTLNLKIGNNEFVQIKTSQMDRLMKDFQLDPINSED